MTALSVDNRTEGGFRYSTLIKLIIVTYIVKVPFFWYLHTYQGLSQQTSGRAMSIISLSIIALVLAGPWLKLAGQRDISRSQRFDKMIIAWLFICLIPRFIYELPWLFFLDEIRYGVLNNSLYTYLWAPYFLGGDSRYLNGDPLVYVLEVLAVFVGIFEGYALYKFFAQGRRFTNLQLGYIMAGMVIEGFMPMVYIGVEVVNKLGHTSGSTFEIVMNFFVLNSIWSILPTLTFVWAMKRVARQDLQLT